MRSDWFWKIPWKSGNYRDTNCHTLPDSKVPAVLEQCLELHWSRGQHLA